MIETNKEVLVGIIFIIVSAFLLHIFYPLSDIYKNPSGPIFYAFGVVVPSALLMGCGIILLIQKKVMPDAQ